jgi:hypothetical protein
MTRFERMLAQCIDDVKADRSSLEDCLARRLSVRGRLEPLLRLALEIRGAPDIRPSPGFRVRARVWLAEQIHEREAAARWPWACYRDQTDLEAATQEVQPFPDPRLHRRGYRGVWCR